MLLIESTAANHTPNESLEEFDQAGVQILEKELVFGDRAF